MTRSFIGFARWTSATKMLWLQTHCGRDPIEVRQHPGGAAWKAGEGRECVPKSLKEVVRKVANVSQNPEKSLGCVKI